MYMLAMDVVRALTSVSLSGRCGRRRAEPEHDDTSFAVAVGWLALTLPSTIAVGSSGDLESPSLFKASGAGLALLSLAI